MAGGGSAAESGEPEFQIAPMIDVLLVLLIFFMSITTAQVEQVDKLIQLPTAADAREKKQDKNQRTVNLRWIATEERSLLTFAGQEWEDREKLVEELKGIADKMDDGKGGTKLEIVLRADKNTPAKEVSAAMQVVGQATAAIAFATYNRQ